MRICIITLNEVSETITYPNATTKTIVFEKAEGVLYLNATSDAHLYDPVREENRKYLNLSMTIIPSKLLEDEEAITLNGSSDNETNVSTANDYLNKSKTVSMPILLEGGKSDDSFLNNNKSDGNLDDNISEENIVYFNYSMHITPPTLLEDEEEFRLNDEIDVEYIPLYGNASGNSSEDYYVR